MVNLVGMYRDVLEKESETHNKVKNSSKLWALRNRDTSRWRK